MPEYTMLCPTCGGLPDDDGPACATCGRGAPRAEVTVGFNPRTCDSTSEGEALAQAITDAVLDQDHVAIDTLLQAASGTSSSDPGEVVGTELVDALLPTGIPARRR